MTSPRAKESLFRSAPIAGNRSNHRLSEFAVSRSFNDTQILTRLCPAPAETHTALRNFFYHGLRDYKRALSAFSSAPCH